MIFQQYPNAYLLFDDDQPQPAAVAPPVTGGNTVAAGKRLNLIRTLIALERSRDFQDTIVRKERQRQRTKQLAEQYQADRKALEIQRQRCVWATLLAEI